MSAVKNSQLGEIRSKVVKLRSVELVCVSQKQPSVSKQFSTTATAIAILPEFPAASTGPGDSTAFRSNSGAG